MRKINFKTYRWIAAVLSTLLTAVLWFYLKDKFSFTVSWFWLFLMIPVLGLIYVYWEPRNQGKLKLSSLEPIDQMAESNWVKLLPLKHVLFSLGITGIIFCLARPQSKTEFEDITEEGIDIVMAMDLSTSMLSKDFKINRLESAKDVAIEFVEGRKSDRFGIVAYENESYTAVPLTTDKRVIVDALASLETGTFEGGTAIGLGLATAVNRLLDSEAESKIIFLLTDGENNSGNINPIDAADIAKTFGIRVYTIGVGKKGKALSPMYRNPNGTLQYEWADVNIDEKVLKEIANLTGGEYFRATNKESLEEIYKQIDELEKTKFNVNRYSKKSEKYYWFAVGSLTCFLLSFMLSKTIFSSVP